MRTQNVVHVVYASSRTFSKKVDAMRQFHKRQGASLPLVIDVIDSFRQSLAPQFGLKPRPIENVRILLAGEVKDGTMERWHRPIQLLTMTNPSGYHLFHGRVQLPDGQKVQRPLMAGQYLLRVESEMYQSAEQTISIPVSRSELPIQFQLQPSISYQFPHTQPPPTILYGCVCNTAQQGIVQTVVTATPHTTSHYITDELGQWLLQGFSVDEKEYKESSS